MKHKKLNKSHRVKQVKIAFTNKPITAWGGIGSLIAQFLERIEFREWTESSIPIKETSNNSGGIYEKVLSLFLTVLVGGDRFSHLSWWGHGVEAIQVAFSVKWFPAAASTMTRFWGKINKQSLANHLGDKARALTKMIVEWEGITKDNLNLDSTVLTRYGNQEGAKKGYNPKKRGRPSHHPILAFLGSGHVVNIRNRPGDTFSGHQAKDFFIQSLTNLGDNFRVRRVLCDSGFYNIDFINYLESESYRYIMGVPIWQIFQREIQRLKDWEQIEEGIDITEFKFEHIDNKWTFPRRYVVVRQEIAKRPKASGKQLSLFQEIEELKGYRYSLMIT
ncbi:MAG: transposase, partial [candidate division Zixibacteria bacterium]|nr:transposase [candidate division Zixibacteria bacterium]